MMLYNFWISSLQGSHRFVLDVPDDVMNRWRKLPKKLPQGDSHIVWFAKELGDDRFLGWGRCMVMTPI